MSKCDDIFDLLVKDGQIIIPQGLKDPPLEQKKKMGFFKFHNFLGHKNLNVFFLGIWCIKLWRSADFNLEKGQICK